MDREIQSASRIAGTISLPGDKSVSHRYAMLASLAEGRSVITNYSTGADCASTLACMGAMGVPYTHEGTTVSIDGVGLRGLRPPAGPLDAGNSGTTIRLLSGILAGQPFETSIGGDESLSKRPMKRIMTPLEQMGARIDARDGTYPPLTIHGGSVRPIRYELPMASAQVKTAVLFAGLFADGTTTAVEPMETRNHSEIALRQFGAQVSVDRGAVSVEGGPRLVGQNLRVPSDLSSAAFFIAAALLLPASELRIEGVGLNPTRTALLDVLNEMGARIEIRHDALDGEPTGTLVVRGGVELTGGEIAGAVTAAVIDEVPMLAVLGAVSREGLKIRNAAELRVKETDRISTVAENLRRMGATVTTHDDGIDIEGGAKLKGADLESFGDHRIAMAFTVAALAAEGPSTMANAEAASVSFPEFYDLLERVTGNVS
jgi:3-phosphoshikimate 1-carboxyvinyltransferase